MSVKIFQDNILGCIRKYNDHSGAKKWLQRAGKELDEKCYIKLIYSIETELLSHDLFHQYILKKVSLEKTDIVLLRIKNLLKKFDFKAADQCFIFSEDHIDQSSYEKLKNYYLDLSRKESKKDEDARKLKKKMFGTKFSGLKEELQVDYKTYLDHLDTPALKKYSLENFNVYLTKSLLPDLVLSSNKNGSYRFFSWDDRRARSLIQAELGDSVSLPGHCDHLDGSNELEIIGDFTPSGNDLTHIQYETKFNKGYFESAINSLSNSDELILTKISVDSFVNMKEVIPTGAQGRAIYADKSYIIDGAAGTGKTTTVIQKILILTKQKKIDTNKICVVVKNNDVEHQFRTLLKNIGVEGIKILTVDEFLFENKEINFSGVDVDFLKKVENDLDSYCKVFNRVLNDKLSSNVKQSTPYDAKIFDIFIKNQDFRSALDKYDILCADIHVKRKELSEYIKKSKDEIKAKRIEIEHEILEDEIERIKKIKYDGATSDSLYDIHVNEVGIDQVSQKFLDNIEVKSVPLMKTFISNTKERKEKLTVTIEKIRDSIDTAKEELVIIFYSDNFLSILFKDKVECKASILYANKENNDISKIHTLIVDEAQDVSKFNIELFRLISENSILVGDEAQNENINGIGRWSNIHNNKFLFKSENINIHKLRHNFRQTYELGLVSYNYRQLILGNDIEDIKSDYFENQIGFNIPELFCIKEAGEILSIILVKLKYIKDSFTKKFPLVFVYERNIKFYEDMLDSKDISYTDDPKNEAADVLLIISSAIAGREFPVVMVTVSRNTPEKNIYIMLSRARFDLAVLVNANYKIENNLMMLCDHGMIIKN